MTDEETKSRRKKGVAGGAALLAAGAVAGGVLAGTLSASAADSSSAANTAASGYNAAAAPNAGPGGPGHGRAGGATPVRGDEKQLTGSDAEKARAAALRAAPGGTVYRVETDAGDAKYEAHVAKSDGSLVTVKLNSAFTVTGVESGMGAGDPAPPR